jgi:hypothetical protein
MIAFIGSKRQYIKDQLIQYIANVNNPDNTKIDGKLRVFYDNKPNSKGYHINGYDFGVYNKSNPFSSKDEVDAFITRITEQFEGDETNSDQQKQTNKSKLNARKLLTKINKIVIQPVPNPDNIIKDDTKTTGGCIKYKRKATNSRNKLKSRRNPKYGRKTYKNRV